MYVVFSCYGEFCVLFLPMINVIVCWLLNNYIFLLLKLQQILFIVWHFKCLFPMYNNSSFTCLFIFNFFGNKYFKTISVKNADTQTEYIQFSSVCVIDHTVRRSYTHTHIVKPQTHQYQVLLLIWNTLTIMNWSLG